MLPETHRFANRKSLALEELRDEYWALDTRGTYSETIIRACAKAVSVPTINGNCNGFPAIAAMVAAGCSRVRHAGPAVLQQSRRLPRRPS